MLSTFVLATVAGLLQGQFLLIGDSTLCPTTGLGQSLASKIEECGYSVTVEADNAEHVPNVIQNLGSWLQEAGGSGSVAKIGFSCVAHNTVDVPARPGCPVVPLRDMLENPSNPYSSCYSDGVYVTKGGMAFEDYLETLVVNLRQAGIEPFFFSAGPVDEEKEEDYGVERVVTNERLVLYNAALEDFCRDKGVVYIDLYTPMEPHVGDLGVDGQHWLPVGVQKLVATSFHQMITANLVISNLPVANWFWLVIAIFVISLVGGGLLQTQHRQKSG